MSRRPFAWILGRARITCSSHPARRETTAGTSFLSPRVRSSRRRYARPPRLNPRRRRAAAWASRALRVGITGASAAGGGTLRGRVRTGARVRHRKKTVREGRARDGTEHSHSHSHGGVEHSHSHGGHSHAPGDAVAHPHPGHTHGGGGGKRAWEGRGGKGGRKGGARRAELKSSSWAKGSGGRAARREAAKAEERRKVKAGRRGAGSSPRGRRGCAWTTWARAWEDGKRRRRKSGEGRTRENVTFGEGGGVELVVRTRRDGGWALHSGLFL